MRAKPTTVTSTQDRVIILAGGEGERMRDTVTSWLGYHRPKQYCTFVGTRSMLQHTVDWARALVACDRITTVIGQHHRRFLQTEGNREICGRILEQPSQKDTGPGLFFALTYVMAENPGATVMVFPSDQYVFPEGPFLETVGRAVNLAKRCESRVILLVAVPDCCETDYGWISCNSNAPPLPGFAGVRGIDTFIEKPDSEMAESCLLSGSYWNTMIMIAKARTLWQLGRRELPSLMAKFETLRRVLCAVNDGRVDSRAEEIAIRHLFHNLKSANFSQHVLENVTDRLLALPLSKVKWSDWGRPSRIVDSLAQIGKVPHFLYRSSRQQADWTQGRGNTLRGPRMKQEKTAVLQPGTGGHRFRPSAPMNKVV